MLTAAAAHKRAIACMVKKLRSDIASQLLATIEAGIEEESTIGRFELELTMSHGYPESSIVAFVIQELRNRGFSVTGSFDGVTSSIQLEW